MPEGDALHRAADRLQVLVGERVEASSPNPRGLATGVARAVDTLTGLATGTIALAALAVAGIAAGLWPRLREYQ